ncbi:hypothetical protein, partial [Helicobacter sp. 13S00482-2]|uniref:hypothetical protein n=1 Tax=Helicobacter sp. 13S00482-2 TaxID=1476200 RepID=UPI00117A0FBA
MTTMNFLRTILHISAKNTDVSDNYSLGGGGSDLLKAPCSNHSEEFNDTEGFEFEKSLDFPYHTRESQSARSRNERFSGDFHNHSSAKQWDSLLACSAQASLDKKTREGFAPDGPSRPVNPKSSKKAFFPLFSLVLSTLLLPFTADIAQAALSSSDIRLLSADHGNLNRPEVYSSGDARCLLSGDKACGRVTQSFANMFNITKNSTYSDVYYLKYNYNIG